MDTQEQDFHDISSGKEAPTTSSPLDTLVKTLADGTISRGQALKLMGAGTAAVASLGLVGCGSKDQAKGGSSGSGQPSGASTSDTTVGKKGSTLEQGPDAEEVAAAAKRAMEKYHLKAVLARVTEGTEEMATVAMGESMTGVPATADMHFRNGAVAISYLGTVLLQLVDEGKVGLDDTIDWWLPKAPASDKVTLRMLANCTSGYPDFVQVKSFADATQKDPFRAWTTEEQLAYVAGEPLFYEPGTNWSYAHTNFVRLGEALSSITGKLLSEKSHKEQVGSSLVGFGGPTKTCPEGVCMPQTSGFHYGIGTAMLGGWILQRPSFFGWGALHAYLPEKDLAIAASATLDKEAKVGLNGGEMVFNEIAAVLAPDHPPKP